MGPLEFTFDRGFIEDCLASWEALPLIVQSPSFLVQQLDLRKGILYAVDAFRAERVQLFGLLDGRIDRTIWFGSRRFGLRFRCTA